MDPSRIEPATQAPEGERRVLRIFRFRPRRPAFDSILRDVMVPDLARVPGCQAILLGRKSSEDPIQSGERLVATVWESHRCMAEGVGTSFDRPLFHPELLVETEDRRLDIVPLCFGFDSGGGPATLLRLVVGATRPGLLHEYVTVARIGTAADVEAGHGPLVLYLGELGPDQFAAVSAWGDWPSVAEATGGSFVDPGMTRHHELLAGWTTEHYEVVTVHRASAREPAPAS